MQRFLAVFCFFYSWLGGDKTLFLVYVKFAWWVSIVRASVEGNRMSAMAAAPTTSRSPTWPSDVNTNNIKSYEVPSMLRLFFFASSSNEPVFRGVVKFAFICSPLDASVPPGGRNHPRGRRSAAIKAEPRKGASSSGGVSCQESSQEDER